MSSITSFVGQAGGTIGGLNKGSGTTGGGPKPSTGELAAQIRFMATQAAGSKTCSAVTSLLDPMYDLFQRSEKKNPSLAEKVTDWALDTSKNMQKTAVKGARKLIDDNAAGAKNIAETFVPGSSRFIDDLLHDPKNLFA
jgi:hypothetical protein